MLKKLLPQETSFFDYFEEHVALTIDGCRELQNLLSHSGDATASYARIKDIEHKADGVIHNCMDALHRTFITPMDRPDIQRLIQRLDDIIDAVDEVASRLAIYEITEYRSESLEIAALLIQAVERLQDAVKGLRAPKHEVVDPICIEIHKFENQADEVMRRALGRLFKEGTDPLMVIKWNEIFQHLERAVDRCEDAADVIRGVVIEAS